MDDNCIIHIHTILEGFAYPCETRYADFAWVYGTLHLNVSLNLAWGIKLNSTKHSFYAVQMVVWNKPFTWYNAKQCRCIHEYLYNLQVLGGKEKKMLSFLARGSLKKFRPHQIISSPVIGWKVRSVSSIHNRKQSGTRLMRAVFSTLKSGNQQETHHSGWRFKFGFAQFEKFLVQD